MGDSSIEWTNKTWNPTRGCRRISPGCEHCYAETMAARFCGAGRPFEGLIQLGKQGPRWNGEGRFVPDKLDEPLHWRKPARVFVNSMSDLFFEEFSDEEIAAVFGVMAACPQHTFQVLTKRPERALEWFRWAASHQNSAWEICAFEASDQIPPNPPKRFSEELIAPPDVPEAWPLPNVHIGVSVENQHYADERIPLLLQLPAAVRFVSYEPALGPVDFGAWASLGGDDHGRDSRAGDVWRSVRRGIDWVIVGGESGPGARPFELAWARGVVQQCKAAGVPVFVKQLGACASDPVNGIAGAALRVPDDAKDLISLRLKDRKGGAMEEWPEDLRVREFPEVRPC